MKYGENIPPVIPCVDDLKLRCLTIIDVKYENMNFKLLMFICLFHIKKIYMRKKNKFNVAVILQNSEDFVFV